jgi:hypothetical protein
MLPLQFVAVEVFTIAYILGALTQNWLISTGVCSTLLYAVFYASDFFALPTDTDIYYHVWLFAIAVAAGLAGHIYSYALQCKQLIRFNYHKSKDAEGKRNTAIALGDIAAFLLFASSISTVLGINLWTERTVIGVSPIGTLHETAGIALTLVGGFVLIATSIAMMLLEVRVRIAVKYFWLFVVWVIGYLITDYGYYHYKWASGVPELLGAVLYLGMTVLVILGAIYLPVRRSREDKHGKKKPISSDIFFHKKGYAIVFFGGIAATVLVAIVAFILIISWPEESLAAGAWLLLAVSGLSIVLSFSIFLVLPDKISSLRTASEVVKVSKQPIYQGSASVFNLSESDD